MAIPTLDLSWIWSTLNQIWSSIATFFGQIWESIQYITNLAQGIVAGFSAFGSLLWDSITKFGGFFQTAFSTLGGFLKDASGVFGNWFYTAMGSLKVGLDWIADNLYKLGNWAWNSASYIADTIRNALSAMGNWFITAMGDMAKLVSEYWNNVAKSINDWFTSLLRTFREKMIATVTADVTIATAWKSGERISEAKSLSDILYSTIGIVISPIIGYLVGSIVDKMVPIPSTASYPLIPEIPPIVYTPPSLEIPKPEVPSPPSEEAPYRPPSPPPPSGYGLPLDLPQSSSATIRTTVDRSISKPSTVSVRTTVDESISESTTVTVIAYIYE